MFRCNEFQGLKSESLRRGVAPRCQAAFDKVVPAGVGHFVEKKGWSRGRVHIAMYNSVQTENKQKDVCKTYQR